MKELLVFPMTLVLLGAIGYTGTSLGTRPDSVDAANWEMRAGETLAPKNQKDSLRKEFVNAIERRNLNGLIRLKNELEKAGAAKSVDLFADVCSAFGSYDFSDDRQYLFARECSKNLLENVENLPINLELRMMENLQGVEEYRSGLIPPEKWEEDRVVRIRLLYRLWNRLQRDIDRTFDIADVKNRPIGNVPVPGPYMPGVRPEDVKEPDIRAKYLEAIQANKAKGEKFNLQVQLHRLDKTLPGFVERMLTNFYSIEPKNLNELETNMRLFALDAESRKRILDAVNLRFYE